MARVKTSPELRGYDRTHRVGRAVWARIVAADQAVCGRCLRPILPGESWDLDHRDDRKGYRGAAHSSCNRAAGGRLSHYRARPSRDWLA
jgi:hypothetical protein